MMNAAAVMKCLHQFTAAQTGQLLALLQEADAEAFTFFVSAHVLHVYLPAPPRDAEASALLEALRGRAGYACVIDRVPPEREALMFGVMGGASADSRRWKRSLALLLASCAVMLVQSAFSLRCCLHAMMSRKPPICSAHGSMRKRQYAFQVMRKTRRSAWNRCFIVVVM